MSPKFDFMQSGAHHTDARKFMNLQYKNQRALGPQVRITNNPQAFNLDFPQNSWTHPEPSLGPHVGPYPEVADP